MDPPYTFLYLHTISIFFKTSLLQNISRRHVCAFLLRKISYSYLDENECFLFHGLFYLLAYFFKCMVLLKWVPFVSWFSLSFRLLTFLDYEAQSLPSSLLLTRVLLEIVFLPFPCFHCTYVSPILLEERKILVEHSLIHSSVASFIIGLS